MKIKEFSASWCRPCIDLKPILDSVCNEFYVDLEVLDIDDINNDWELRKYGIRGVPTLVLLDNDKVVGIKVGLQTRDQLIQMLDYK